MKRITIALVTVATFAAACGSSTGSSSGGASRTVLVDYKHDAFASSFMHYYPSNVAVHPGDTVNFGFTWTGEPHSVTMGKVVDNMFKYLPLIEKYPSEQAALDAGESPQLVKDVDQTFTRIPGMTGNHGDIFQPGAKPCFVPKFEDVPEFADSNGTPVDPTTVPCPKGDERQPEFHGTEGLYNSGFVPFQGARANKFVVHVAKNAVPGTYNYFCNYHWTDMHGTVRIVPKGKSIPSGAAVARQARTQINNDAKNALKLVKKTDAGHYGNLTPPLSGLSLGEHDQSGVQVNDFYPKTVHVAVGQPLTWTNGGYDHTISFNVPKYFPVFTIAKSGDVVWDPKSYNAVNWTVEPKPSDEGDGPPPPSRHIDVGKWDGSGGYHSSGLLGFGDTFTITFTKPGTYPFACVIHPPMIGTVVVKA
jgi:plastocyanin